MKISEERKRENRGSIIRAAVDAITEKGMKGATMREIARGAGLGDATIYNYFSTKEAIVYAYYEEQLDVSVERLRSVAGFNEFSLQEQLQAFFESQLELFLPDREFVDVSFRAITFSLTHDYQYLKPIRSRFFRIISDLFEAAIEAGEIPDQVFLELTCHFFWDYYVGVIFYWLRDGSNQFQNTTLLLDKSLDLAVALIKAGVVNKAFDMASFLFRHHIIDRLGMIRDHAEVVQKVKRQFMGGPDGRRDSRK
ncbi:MAG: TetR family transcriptional regulator [Deltaproteobacteria bacterium]|nr:TetR family transcriptional regulator [Deltaproteobacteria bacterium]